ncbi:anti-sigma factor [Anthocerotibacter panamensis]|uniref:anti-sigma factor n=1 Tax=Anthocerotibacter panamensis TaxID=2857077 RepID=UPI001C4050E1|nr:anti-sigma factor [Anthocerotibacter panamensis]
MDARLPESWEELLAGHTLGDLAPEEQRVFNQLLQQHPELAQEVDQLRETLALLPYALTASSAPPPLLRNRILEAARTLPHNPIDPQPITVPVPQRPRLLRWSPALGSIAALLALMLGLDSYRLRQELSTTKYELAKEQSVVDMLHQRGTRLVSFRPTGKVSGASGSLMITPQDKAAVLTLKDVTPLPEGQVYRLWAVVNGKKLVCGEFTPNATGTVFVHLLWDPQLGQAPLVVTLEPAEKTAEPTGPMVLSSERGI